MTDDESEMPALVTEAVETLAKFVVPLYVDQNGAPDLIGTGFFVRSGHDTFLVSAAHVFDKAVDETLDEQPVSVMYFYSTPQKKRYLLGRMKKTRFEGSRELDHNDIGILRLDAPHVPPFPEIDRFAMDISYLRPSYLPRSGKEYLVVGFPASRSKVRPGQRGVIAEPYGHRSPPIAEDQYVAYHTSPDRHVIVPFHRTKVFDPHGRRMHAPDPHGLSGSPVIVLFEENESEANRVFPVVAVLIEIGKHPRPVLIATDVSLILAALADL